MLVNRKDFKELVAAALTGELASNSDQTPEAAGYNAVLSALATTRYLAQVEADDCGLISGNEKVQYNG
jgi:hypothetical protein